MQRSNTIALLIAFPAAPHHRSTFRHRLDRSPPETYRCLDTRTLTVPPRTAHKTTAIADAIALPTGLNPTTDSRHWHYFSSTYRCYTLLKIHPMNITSKNAPHGGRGETTKTSTEPSKVCNTPTEEAPCGGVRNKEDYQTQHPPQAITATTSITGPNFRIPHQTPEYISLAASPTAHFSRHIYAGIKPYLGTPDSYMHYSIKAGSKKLRNSYTYFSYRQPFYINKEIHMFELFSCLIISCVY